jgi:hypothetical protein
MPPVNGHAAPQQGQSHLQRWEAALEQALQQASGLGPPGDYNVSVEFWAHVNVKNPGTIQGYTVVLTPH